MLGNASEKTRLAQELLSLLKGEVSARPKAKRVDAPGETMVAGHQKRDNKRFTDPMLRVSIGPIGYDTIDWSLGGCQVKHYVGTLKRYARVKVTVSDGRPDSTYYSVDCRVARVDSANRTLSLQFETLSRGMFDWLSGLQMG